MWINHYLVGECYRNQLRYPLDRNYWLFKQPRGPREMDIFPRFGLICWVAVVVNQNSWEFRWLLMFCFLSSTGPLFVFQWLYDVVQLVWTAFGTFTIPRELGELTIDPQKLLSNGTKLRESFNRTGGLQWWDCVTWLYIFSTIISFNFSLFLLQCCVCSVVFVSHHPYKKVSGIFLLLKYYSENTQNIVPLFPTGGIAPVHLSISPVLPSIWIRRLQCGHWRYRCLIAVIGWPSKWLAKI